MPEGLPFRLEDYLELLDWTGRIIHSDKRGAIPDHTPPILQRLNIETKNWLYSTQYFERSFKGLAGQLETVKSVCRQLGYRRPPSVSAILT